MPKPSSVSLPPHLVRAIMRRRFVWTVAGRASATAAIDKLQCAQFGHRWENVGIEQVCTRCRERVI
jgi:hypothetical protein